MIWELSETGACLVGEGGPQMNSPGGVDIPFSSVHQRVVNNRKSQKQATHPISGKQLRRIAGSH